MNYYSYSLLYHRKNILKSLILTIKTPIIITVMFESMVDVAQLVEHQIVALVAVGSIPTIHPINQIFFLALCVKKIYIFYVSYGIGTSRDVAQLVAHSLWERGVASSSLAIPTIFHSLKTSFNFSMYPTFQLVRI